MNVFRPILRPLRPMPFSLARASVCVPPTTTTFKRTIVYLDGLVEEDRATINQPSPEVLKLQEESEKYVDEAWNRLTGEHAATFSLPKDLLLQVFTHKSFRHGVLPYNERLAFYGRRLFSLQVACLVAAHKSDGPTSIAGRDVEALKSKTAQGLLHSRGSIFKIAKESGLLPIIRWAPAQKFDNLMEVNPRTTGLLEVGAQTVYASIGAVAMCHGGAKAEQFIKKVIMAGPFGVTNATE
ncbi:ribonuclease-III-like-domain-containing protein [Myxozyma melibiosi]|uniref:Ribonuclease-III-like-domain-containing protein n=1 Tax=Myxozyma melibiosi TaxID=54550 RepID=A0ABR1FDC8_9ASCO